MALDPNVDKTHWQNVVKGAHRDVDGDDKQFTLAVDKDSWANGSIVSGIKYDALTGEETSSTVETYRYYEGGTGGTLLATVVVTYSDDTKCFISSVVRT